MNQKRIGSITVAGGSSMEKAVNWRLFTAIMWGSWRGGTSPISQPIFFRNPTSPCSNPIPTSRVWKKSQCYTYHLFSLCICKITASKCDPTKTQKCTRIYKDVLKITRSFQTVIKLSSSEFIAISPCHFHSCHSCLQEICHPTCKCYYSSQSGRTDPSCSLFQERCLPLLQSHCHRHSP